MSDPPLSDIDFKNKMTWVWTTLKFRVSILKWWSSFCGKHSETNQIINRDFTRHKVLPSGIGHTTSCFLSVEGSNKPAPYIVTEEGETMEIEKVQQLGRFSKNVLEADWPGSQFDWTSFFLKTFQSKRIESKSTTTQEWFQNEFIFRFAWAAILRIERAPNLKIIKSESSLVRVLWPQVRCRLLNAEVQILDSPGVDVTPDLDLWIDKYCLNADVFVLVGGFSNSCQRVMIAQPIRERHWKPDD